MVTAKKNLYVVHHSVVGFCFCRQGFFPVVAVAAAAAAAVLFFGGGGGGDDDDSEEYVG